MQPKNTSSELFGLNVKASKRPLKAGLKQNKAHLGLDYEGLEKIDFIRVSPKAFAQSIDVNNSRLSMGERNYPKSGRPI
jgi:hypothetical protein